MSESQETHLGFKKITISNLQNFDEATQKWREITSEAKTNENWIKFFSYSALDPKIPKEIEKALEAARGAMIYGLYFKPLLTLGAEQCWRILETGVRIRCQQFEIPTTRKIKNGKSKGKVEDISFGENINALVNHGKITKEDASRLEAGKELRNYVSHPKPQLSCQPGSAQSDLNSVVDCLNDLFR